MCQESEAVFLLGLKNASSTSSFLPRNELHNECTLYHMLGTSKAMSCPEKFCLLIKWSKVAKLFSSFFFHQGQNLWYTRYLRKKVWISPHFLICLHFATKVWTVFSPFPPLVFKTTFSQSEKRIMFKTTKRNFLHFVNTKKNLKYLVVVELLNG